MSSVTLVGPLTHSVLYLRQSSSDAVPQYISGRTSYLQVRLAFHPYPQLIRAVFNRHRFGPLPGCSPGLALAMGRSPGFGSTPDNHYSRCSHSLSLWLRLLKDLAGYRKSLAGSFCKRHAVVRTSPDFDCLGTQGFRFCFTPLPGFFSPFPHGTGALSVATGSQPWKVVLPASHRVPRVPCYSGAAASFPKACSYEALTLSGPAFHPAQSHSLGYDGVAAASPLRSYNPLPATPAGLARVRFGLIRVRSPLLTDSLV